MSRIVEAPFLVALNLTRRCNLKCAHCYLDAGTLNSGDRDELATPEVYALLNEIAALSHEITSTTHTRCGDGNVRALVVFALNVVVRALRVRSVRIALGRPHV